MTWQKCGCAYGRPVQDIGLKLVVRGMVRAWIKYRVRVKIYLNSGLVASCVLVCVHARVCCVVLCVCWVACCVMLCCVEFFGIVLCCAVHLCLTTVLQP